VEKGICLYEKKMDHNFPGSAVTAPHDYCIDLGCAHCFAQRLPANPVVFFHPWNRLSSGGGICVVERSDRLRPSVKLALYGLWKKQPGTGSIVNPVTGLSPARHHNRPGRHTRMLKSMMTGHSTLATQHLFFPES
jgi:hypothetical protein